MGMPKNLFLVRHGQSEGNAARRIFEETGSEEVYSDEFLGIHESQYKLTALGIEQAQKAGQWLADNRLRLFDRMLVSNIDRAMQTAAYLNLPDPSWMPDFNLRESDGGLFTTITPSKRDSVYLDQQKFYASQPFLFRPPQGESMADLCQRIKLVLDTLARECDNKNVIIVCHGHVIRAFRIILERMSLKKSNEMMRTQDELLKVPNCSIVHYTRQDPIGHNGLSNHLDWVRIIRPAGGGNLQDEFSFIQRKKYSNEELLKMVAENRVP